MTGLPADRLTPAQAAALDKLTPAQAGALDEEAFMRRFGGVYEHSSAYARAAWRRRPFGGFHDLANAFEAALRGAPKDRQLALIRLHPDLAGREAEEGRLSESSATEQASAGLSRLSAQEAARLGRLNRAYRDKFGFPLVIAVRDQDKASILAQGEARLQSSPEHELDTAIAQIVEIGRLRLRELVMDNEGREKT